MPGGKTGCCNVGGKGDEPEDDAFAALALEKCCICWGSGEGATPWCIGG